MQKIFLVCDIGKFPTMKFFCAVCLQIFREWLYEWWAVPTLRALYWFKADFVHNFLKVAPDGLAIFDGVAAEQISGVEGGH